MHMRNIGGILGILLMIQMNVAVHTDWFHGKRDFFGPYPRIPDAEKLKKEIAFAEECKKHIFPPKDKFMMG